jgi:hypothetical protein
MIIFLFEKFKSYEMVFRHQSIQMWQNLVKNSITCKDFKIPNDYKEWIQIYYSKNRGDKSILKHI